MRNKKKRNERVTVSSETNVRMPQVLASMALVQRFSNVAMSRRKPN